MVSKKVEKDQIKVPIIIISLVFLFISAVAIYTKASAPEHVSVEFLVSDIILVVVIPGIIFLVHVILISKEIKTTHLSLSTHCDKIYKSIESTKSLIENMIYSEIIEVRQTSAKENHERNKLSMALKDKIKKRQKESEE